MNGLIKQIFLSSFLFVAFSAFGTNDQVGKDTAPTVAEYVGVQDGNEYYEIKRRDKILKRSHQRYNNACGSIEGRHECKYMCWYIYDGERNRKDCESLPVKQIEVLADIHELLEDPDDDELESISLEDFEVYLNVSISAFDKLIGTYSRGEAKELLLWIVSDEDITEIVRDEEDEFAALKRLFKEIVGGEDNTYEPFLQRIDGRDKLMEVAIEEGNYEAVEWFHDYIFETTEACSDNEVSLGCFKNFCEIGKDIDDHSREDWMGFEDFEDYIEDIVEDRINENNWMDGNNIQDVDDVTDFYKELCGNLATASE